MRSLCDMDTIQIEITDACVHQCANCTRFCGHKEPYFMPLDQFKQAIDSMIDYPKMTGVMGGEPLLHPDFEEMCAYAVSKIKREQLGLWTCMPKGYELYAKTIVNTFGNLFHNDHSRNDIFHAPVLVGVEEIYKDRREMFYCIDHCWGQMSWSASINPRGAFFCEIAASLSNLYKGEKGWPIEPGWWWRTPKDFREQIETWCPMCGLSIPLPRRASTDTIDDISPRHLERLKGRSKKVKSGKYVESSLILVKQPQPLAAYKDMSYRQRIAAEYGIGIEINEKRFLNPFLLSDRPKTGKSLFEHFKQQGGCVNG